MKKRSERVDQLPPNCGNVRWYGLHRGQTVQVDDLGYKGWAFVKGDPPQGPGVYVVTLSGKLILLGGENIREATEPT